VSDRPCAGAGGGGGGGGRGRRRGRGFRPDQASAAVAADEVDGEVRGEEQEERGGGGPAAAAGRGAPEVGGAEEGFQRRHGPRPGCAVLVLCASARVCSIAGFPLFRGDRGEESSLGS
jgi:hypothetical protein